MSYQVLARKWRPQQFDEVSGQQAVVQMLTNGLNRQRLHHAYLFSGTRGVGKTTLARILAKCLNCEIGISAAPCGRCHACQAIDQGRFIDLIEVDAASRTKVEETRELLDNVHYAPTHGRFKIYLIDEVHMLSNHSFNALLKTLEEPPAHVKFLLATTEPQKLPITVLSRCLQFHLTALASVIIEKRLSQILQQETIKFEQAALPLIADAAKGSLRDALSLLDQAIAYGNGTIHQKDVTLMLGLVDQCHLIALVHALISQDGEKLMAIVDQMATNAADFNQATDALLSLFHRLAIAQAIPSAPIHDSLPAEFSQQPIINPADIQLYYQIALIGKRDLPYAPDPKTGFEMIMLRMLAFQPQHYLANEEKKHSTAFPPRPKPSNPSPTQSGTTLETLQTNWANVVTQIPLQGLSRALIKHTVIDHINHQTVMLHLSPQYQSLLNPTQQKQIEQALSQYLNTAIKLTIQIIDPKQTTPAAQHKQHIKKKYADAEESIRNDPAVQQLIRTFDASVEKITSLDAEK